MKTPEQYEDTIESLANKYKTTKLCHDVALAQIDKFIEHLGENKKEIDALHKQLAAERLRADAGWARYENANLGQRLAREELAFLKKKYEGNDEPHTS